MSKGPAPPQTEVAETASAPNQKCETEPDHQSKRQGKGRFRCRQKPPRDGREHRQCDTAHHGSASVQGRGFTPASSLRNTSAPLLFAFVFLDQGDASRE